MRKRDSREDVSSTKPKDINISGGRFFSEDVSISSSRGGDFPGEAIPSSKPHPHTASV